MSTNDKRQRTQTRYQMASPRTPLNRSTRVFLNRGTFSRPSVDIDVTTTTPPPARNGKIEWRNEYYSPSLARELFPAVEKEEDSYDDEACPEED